MDGINGHGDLASCALAHEAVSWVHLPLQLSVHACQAWADRRRALAPSLACIPSQLPPLPAWPFFFFLSLPAHAMAGFFSHHFHCLGHRQVRWHHTSSPSADFVHLFSLWLVCASGCCGPHRAQIIFSWTVIPNLRNALTEGLGLVREEGKGIGCFLRDFIVGVSSRLVGWDPMPQWYNRQWCSLDSLGQSEAFLFVLSDTSQIHPLSANFRLMCDFAVA